MASLEYALIWILAVAALLAGYLIGRELHKREGSAEA